MPRMLPSTVLYGPNVSGKSTLIQALQCKRRERERNKRYLIVCEGTKTEPQYLQELLVDLRIRPQLVRVAPCLTNNRR